MNNIKSYHLIKDKGDYVLLIHLNQIDMEFANELGGIEETKKKRFYDEIKAHIEEKFPKINIPICRVMLGTMLVATIPLMSTTAHAATLSSSTQSLVIQEYAVLPGDTLYKIAQKFSVAIEDIKSANNLIGDTIYTNQMLNIPSNITNVSYKVQAGDTLYKISQIYNVDVAKIKYLNNMTGDTIYIGQILIIKQAAPPVTSTVTTYKVLSGDTLWKISQKFSLSIDELKRINNLQTDTLYIGQTLSVTSTPVNVGPTITYKDYQVISGDNLWKISIANGIPQSELMIVNGMNESTQLKIGQIIRIPVHNVPIKPTMGVRNGEYLDWWTEAQYVFPINKVAKVTDYETGKTFTVKRTIGANHSDTEPLTFTDTEIAKSIWGGYSWKVRPVVVEVDGRKIAGSMTYMPHGVYYILNNGFDGHFDIHFLNSTRHVDGLIDPDHQAAVKIAAGITTV